MSCLTQAMASPISSCRPLPYSKGNAKRRRLSTVTTDICPSPLGLSCRMRTDINTSFFFCVYCQGFFHGDMAHQNASPKLPLIQALVDADIMNDQFED